MGEPKERPGGDLHAGEHRGQHGAEFSRRRREEKTACVFCKEDIKADAVICKHCSARVPTSRGDLALAEIRDRIRYAANKFDVDRPISTCEAFCASRYSGGGVGFYECRKMCKEITAAAITAERLHRDLMDVLEDLVVGYGMIDPEPLESLVRQRFAQQGDARLNPWAIRDLFATFLDRIEWRDADERNDLISRSLGALMLMTNPALALAQGLEPLTESDIGELRQSVTSLDLSEEQKREIVADLNESALRRDFRGIAGRAWRWICSATGNRCSTDSSGSSVGGPRG